MVGNDLYRNPNYIIENIFLSGRGLLYNFLRKGRTFKRIFSELEYTQYLDPDEIKEWQEKRLFKLLMHAYQNVPYYNRIFKKLGLRPEDIKGCKDLEKLPVLTKEDVRKNYSELLARNIPRYLMKKVFTSGTSGKPLKLYRDLYSINFENAIVWRQKRLAGVDFSDRFAVLREEHIVPFHVTQAPFWRYSIFEKKLFLSAYHLKRENVPYYVKALKDFRPVAIEAEPSLLYILARLICSEGLRLDIPSLKAIFTSSEILTENYRDLINKVFKVPIYDFYGNAERVAAIGMCERHNYHIIPEAGIVEFLPVAGGKDLIGMEIVGTGLHNYAMPLIRYKTGDVVHLADFSCACGRHSQVIEKINGRMSDFLITSDGRIAIDVCYMALKGLDNIEESQIIQEDIDKILVKVVPARDFSNRDRELLINNIRSFMGIKTQVFVKEVSAIVENRENKFRPFISKVNREVFL